MRALPKNIEEFDSRMREFEADEAESSRIFYERGDSDFTSPRWDIPTGRKFFIWYLEAPKGEYKEAMLERAFWALEPGPNDAHLGNPLN